MTELTEILDEQQRDVHGLPRNLSPGATRNAVDAARKITNVDSQRVRIWTLASAVAFGFPRRLGPDASSDAMSADKKISKKVCHLYYIIWGQMASNHECGAPPVWGQWDIANEDPRIRSIGTAVRWGEQLDKLTETVEKRIVTVQEHPVPIKALRKWQRRRLHLLDYELKGVERIVRGLPT